MAAANVTVIDKIYAHAGQLIGVVIDYIGPASYVQVAGSGDTLTAKDIGLKNIYAIPPSNSGDGLDVVYALINTNKAVQSAELMWVVIATGAEVAGAVVLSAKHVRLMVWGN